MFGNALVRLSVTTSSRQQSFGFLYCSTSRCAVKYQYWHIYIYITVKHNNLLIISLICATCFGPYGPPSGTKIHDLEHTKMF
jgi:hypothetical protein